jgi:hypothetical protein
MVDLEIFSRRLETPHGYLEKLKAFLDANEEARREAAADLSGLPAFRATTSASVNLPE